MIFFPLPFSSIIFCLEDLWGDFISFPWQPDELCRVAELWAHNNVICLSFCLSLPVFSEICVCDRGLSERPSANLYCIGSHLIPSPWGDWRAHTHTHTPCIPRCSTKHLLSVDLVDSIRLYVLMYTHLVSHGGDQMSKKKKNTRRIRSSDCLFLRDGSNKNLYTHIQSKIPFLFNFSQIYTLEWAVLLNNYHFALSIIDEVSCDGTESFVAWRNVRPDHGWLIRAGFRNNPHSDVCLYVHDTGKSLSVEIYICMFEQFQIYASLVGRVLPSGVLQRRRQDPFPAFGEKPA